MNSNPPLLLPCRVRRFFLAMFLSVSTALVARSTQAQQLYQPEIYNFAQRERETGFRLGHARIHSVLGVLGTYDTNSLYSSVNEQSDFVYQLIPGADFVWSSPRLDLNAGYRFTLRRNIDQTIQNSEQQRASLDTKYRLTRTLQLIMADHFEDSSDPADVELLQRVGRRTNEAKGGLKYATPGEDLDISAIYTNLYQQYDANLSGLTFYNNKVSLTSRFNVSSQFRFLPKSVASLNAEYGQTSYNNDSTTGVLNSDSRGFSFGAGLSSQFTRKFSAAARVGGSFLFFSAGPDAKMVSGGLDLQYVPNSSTNFMAGYERNVQISTFTNYHRDHRFRVAGTWRFAHRFEMNEELRIFMIQYSGPNVTLNGVHRDDFVIQNAYRIAYAFVEWAKTRVEYQLDRRSSNAVDPVLGTSTADFIKHQVSIGVDFYY